MLSYSVSAPLPKLIFPHLLLGLPNRSCPPLLVLVLVLVLPLFLPNSLKIYIFFLWNEGARSFAGKKVAAVRAAWQEIWQKMRRNRQNQIYPIL